MMKAIMKRIYLILPLVLLALLLLEILAIVLSCVFVWVMSCPLADDDEHEMEYAGAKTCKFYAQVKYILFHATPHGAAMRFQQEWKWEQRKTEWEFEGSDSYQSLCATVRGFDLLQKEMYLYLLPCDCRKLEEDEEDD